MGKNLFNAAYFRTTRAGKQVSEYQTILGTAAVREDGSSGDNNWKTLRLAQLQSNHHHHSEF